MKGIVAAIVIAVALGAPAVTVPRLTVARVQYQGDDWYANPSSLPNLIRAIRTRTTLAVEPNEVRLTLRDERLWDHPFLHLTGHGDIRLREDEVERLRTYLLRGGFLHIDDNYGLDPAVRRELARVFPDRALVDVPLTHPIYRIVYPFRRGSRRSTSTTTSPRVGSGSSSGIASLSSIRTRAISGTDGRTSAPIPPIRRRRMRRRSGWG